MSIKIDIASDDVAKQIQVLKNFPDLADKHYTPALQRDTKLLETTISANIPRGATSQAFNTFGSKVSGKGFSIKGMVGWFDKSDPWYPNVLEYGSRDHSISSGASVRKAKSITEIGRGTVQRGASDTGTHILVNGRWRTVSKVKGMKAHKFMASGFDAVSSIVELDLFMANEAIIAELAAI